MNGVFFVCGNSLALYPFSGNTYEVYKTGVIRRENDLAQKKKGENEKMKNIYTQKTFTLFILKTIYIRT